MELETRKKIAAIVKKWVDKSEFTQANLANKLGISRITFSAQINGRKSFPVERIRYLMELLGAKVKDVDDIQQLMASDARGALGRVSPLVRVGIKAEAERQRAENLVKEEMAQYDTKGNQDADHRAEILQLKLEHAERENELLSEVVKQLREKDELTKKLLEKNK